MQNALTLCQNYFTCTGLFAGGGDPLSLHSLDVNDDTRVLMQNDVAQDEGSSGGSYNYELSSRALPGACLDSEGRYYIEGLRDEISKNKKNRDDTDSLEECKEKCENDMDTYENLPLNIDNQAGFYYRFKRIKQTFDDRFRSTW